MPQLHFYREGIEVLCFPLHADDVRIGRHSDNDISLPDPKVSRYHACLKREAGQYVVENTSRNGTIVDGVEIDRKGLTDQSVLEIGPWRIIYQATGFGEEDETALGRAKSDRGRARAGQKWGMLGRSPGMRTVFKMIEKTAASPLPVMIHGETGTGKELVARALHQQSGRQGSYIAVNCGAISPNLIESELFGHERGAFTGAIGQHQGAFESAHKGTLFLDEIGELPLELQPKILRVLETGAVKRVGGRREYPFDIRVVAATHRDLTDEIKGGRFREDLYYRLLGVLISLPPLRERVEDIPVLAEHFVTIASPGKIQKSLSRAALERLQTHPWPGNVRELKNVLARSLLLCQTTHLQPHDLQFLTGFVSDPNDSLEGAEKEAIMSALQATQGNKSRAAERLGIAKSTLFRKIKEYDISEN